MADNRSFLKESTQDKSGARFRIILSAAGIIVNVALAYLMNKLNLGFFLDTIGTITVSAIGGLFPGILTAVMSNAFCAIFSSESVYFGFINAIVAIFTVWFIKNCSIKKVINFIAYILIVSFFTGIISAMISWYLLDGVSIARNSETTILFASSIGISLQASYFIYFILVNIIDKGISILIAWLCISFLSQGALERIEKGNWKQYPLNKEQIEDLKKWSKRNKHHMGQRSTAIVISSSIILVLITGWIGIRIYYQNVREEKTIDAYNTLKLASEIISPSQIDTYIAIGENANGYHETQDLLIKIKESSRSIENMFFVKFEKDAGVRIFDLDGENAETVPLIVEYDDNFLLHLPDFLEGKNIEPLEHGMMNNWIRTVFYPIQNSDGKVVCYGVADVSISNMQRYLYNFIIKATLILLGFFILVIAHNLWVTNVTMVYPIRSMAKCVNDFAEMGYGQEQLDKNVKRIRALEIETEDEVEQLYNSICEMTLNISEQMRELRRLSQTTANMQDGLIITMADMVENRDSDTGAHIQKTAAYVKIIVEGLQAKGYYAEKIDEKFISDVVRSAPLHDIGKINISDAILNKPGKLTDEEYEVIKTHTTSGKKIMEDAISTVRGENYLKEARNMAAYHHERWDGKGYPDGLHGEVIPLSARIMAVADVFDALTSPRVYKPAFPLEKALTIIQEGAGTQFDPKCVEVFMDNLPEVKVVLRKYNRNI